MRDNIVLVGFRAVGKTTIGKKLAAKLSYTFSDTDLLICENKGASVNSIVQNEGWQAFRACERTVLQEVGSFRQTVVSTGGGAVLHQDVWDDIKKVSTVVWLTADQDVIVSRIIEDNSEGPVRPTLTGRSVAEEVGSILAERHPLYQKVADFSIDTGRVNPDNAVETIITKMNHNSLGFEG